MTTKGFVEKVEAVLQEKEREAAEWLVRQHNPQDVRAVGRYFRGLFSGVLCMVFALAPNAAAMIAAKILVDQYDKRLDELIDQHYARVGVAT